MLELFFVIFWSMRLDAPGLSFDAKERGYTAGRGKEEKKEPEDGE